MTSSLKSFSFRTFSGLAALLVLSILPFRQSVKADDPAEYRIGIITDLSGAAANFGSQTAVALELVREDFARNHVPVRFILEDTALKTERAISAAQRMLSLENVDAIFVDFTTLSIAVAGVLKANPRPMMYVGATESVVLEHPFAFKSFISYETGCAQLVRQLQAEGKKRIALLQAEAEYAEICARGYKSAASEQYIETYKSGDEVDVQILRMRARGVDAIINMAYEKDTMAMLRAMRKVHYRVPVGLPESHFTSNIRTEFGSFLEGSLTVGVFSPDASFIARARTMPGGNSLGAFDACFQAYTFLTQLGHAVTKCEPDDRACMLEKTAQIPADASRGFFGYKSRIADMRIDMKRATHTGELKLLHEPG